jgi:hypothetical protein
METNQLSAVAASARLLVKIERSALATTAGFDPSWVFCQPRPNDPSWPKADWRLSDDETIKRTFDGRGSKQLHNVPWVTYVCSSVTNSHRNLRLLRRTLRRSHEKGDS